MEIYRDDRLAWFDMMAEAGLSGDIPSIVSDFDEELRLGPKIYQVVPAWEKHITIGSWKGENMDGYLLR